MIYHSKNTEETLEIAEAFAKRLVPGAIACLSGDLGAGKTVFAKGVCRCFGINNTLSPTFSIINVYDGSLPVYHFDVYRINGIKEMEETGYEDYFYGGGICVIEWAEKIVEIVPQHAIWISITVNDNDGRTIKIKESRLK